MEVRWSQRTGREDPACVPFQEWNHWLRSDLVDLLCKDNDGLKVRTWKLDEQTVPAVLCSWEVLGSIDLTSLTCSLLLSLLLVGNKARFVLPCCPAALTHMVQTHSGTETQQLHLMAALSSSKSVPFWL